jgi:DNA-binding NtrC family response regulator
VARVLNSFDLSPLDVLIVSERPDHLRPLIRILDASAARVSACFTIRQAREILSRQSADLLFCDEYLSDGSYRELLQAIRFGQTAASFVLLLHTGEWEEYLDAMRLGVLEVLRCPLDSAEVDATTQRAIAQKARRSAGQLAIEAASKRLRTGDGATEPDQQDLLFDQLLGHAAAALAPTDGSATSAGASTPTPQSGEHRPTVIRRGAA